VFKLKLAQYFKICNSILTFWRQKKYPKNCGQKVQ